jgi:uncharacterized protein YecT (DUF1311 family)
MKKIKHLSAPIALTLLCSPAFAQEHISPVPYPKAPSAGKAKIDKQIRELNKQQKAEADDCVGDNPDYEMETTPEVIWDTTSIYSVVVRENDFCGGAHPNAGSFSNTFDATTGEAYSPDQLYAIRKPLKPTSVGEKGDFEDDVGDAIVDALIDARKPFKDDDDCLLRIKEAGAADSAITYANLALGKDGMYLFALPPHVLLACYEDIVLPYSQLAPYLNKKEATRLHLKLPSVNEATVPWRDMLPNPDVRTNQVRREAIIRVLAHGWSKKDKLTLAELLKAKDDFFAARERNEAVDDGVPEDILKNLMRDQDEDDFLATLLQLDTGFAMHNSYELAQVDEELNSKYQKLQHGNDVLWEDASLSVTKSGLKETERLWLAYRDTWMRLIAAKAPDTTPASVLYELTQDRLTQLSALADELKPTDK